MKVAVVVDYLIQFGGGERVLFDILSLYPNSDIYTSLFIKDNPALKPLLDKKIYTSFIDRFPFKKHYNYFLPFYPIAIESFNLDKYELVISISSAWAKGAITTENTCHISYILTPTRFLWHQFHPLMESRKGMTKRVLYTVLHFMRQWDFMAAQRPDFIMADSNAVKKRINKFYKRNSEVVYPGVDTDFFTPSDDKRGDFYLVVSRIKSHKSIHTAVEAFAKMGKPLVVIGEGNIYPYLRKFIKDNIEFKGYVDDFTLREYYRKAKAVIFPSYEDFGIVPLESVSCGTPVICLGVGGTAETMEDGKTGVFYWGDNADDLIEAVNKFESMKFDKEYLRSVALRFSKDVFKRKFKEFIDKSLEEYRR